MSTTHLSLNVSGHFPFSGITCARVAFHRTSCVREVTWNNQDTKNSKLVIAQDEVKDWSGWIQISVYQVLHLQKATLVDRGWSITGFQTPETLSCHVDLRDPFHPQLHMKNQLLITITRDKMMIPPSVNWDQFEQKMNALSNGNVAPNFEQSQLWSIPFIANQHRRYIPLPVFMNQQVSMCMKQPTLDFLSCLVPRAVAVACLLLGIRCPVTPDTEIDWSDEECLGIMSILAAVCMSAWPYDADINGDCIQTDTWTNPLDVPIHRLGAMTWDCEDGGIIHGIISSFVATQFKNSSYEYASRLSAVVNSVGNAGIMIATVRDPCFEAALSHDEDESSLHAVPVRFKSLRGAQSNAFEVSVEETTAIVCSRHYGHNPIDGGDVNWVGETVLRSDFYEDMLFVVCSESRVMFQCVPPEGKSKDDVVELQQVWGVGDDVDDDFIQLITRPHVSPVCSHSWKQQTNTFFSLISAIQTKGDEDRAWNIVRSDHSGLELWPDHFIRLEELK